MPPKRKSTKQNNSSSKTGKMESLIFEDKIVTKEEEVRERDGYIAEIPVKNNKGILVFKDHKDLQPNLTPKEILQAGSFGGTYFRPIYSSITKHFYDKQWKELPQNWLNDLNILRQISSPVYHSEVNTYKVKCGGDLEMWESSGWIKKQDPYGWFQWYCRFYLGRRSEDDQRQIQRWKNCTGPKGRWKNNLIGKIIKSGSAYDNMSVSPVVRQTLQHWAYKLTKQDFDDRIAVLKKP